ncbi:unnamed protein product [Rotaria sordida]|uniref:W2 domain-containing protein n=1 Tax=Rotaria sordida TaxID=392033 RepID=A0A814VT76_9BILA|nr:unnamed protein product [Rotaria sordida]
MNSDDNDEAIVIQQMIDSLSQDIWQLRWNVSSKVLKPSTIQTSTPNGEKHASFSPLFENAAADTLKTKDRWVGGWAEQASLARNAQNANKTQQPQSKKPQKIEPSQKLISLFSSNAAQEDVKNYLKTFFILTKKKSIIPEQIAILVSSFIQSVDEGESKMITSQYIDMIKYWAKKHPDGEFMVIVGIQVFVSSQGHITVDKDAVNIFSHLLQFFTQNQCVSNESILKWYQKGTHGRNYVGYPVARHMASKYISETFGI